MTQNMISAISKTEKLAAYVKVFLNPFMLSRTILDEEREGTKLMCAI